MLTTHFKTQIWKTTQVFSFHILVTSQIYLVSLSNSETQLWMN